MNIVLLTLVLIIMLTYVGLIITFTIGLKKAFAQSIAEKGPGMAISVIVVFKDEALNLPNMLQAMMHQTLPKSKFELILVNDHSSDESVSIVEHYCSLSSNFRTINLPENKAGKKAAIAYGVSFAIHSLIALTDADCIPSAKWLESISSETVEGSVLMVGPVIMTPLNNFVQKLQALEYSSLMASAAGSCGIGHPVIASSANLVFRKDLVEISEEILNPKVSSGDDMFLLHYVKKLNKGGISFLGNANAIVKTAALESLGQVVNQRKRWASKSIYYDDRDTIITGFIVLLFSIVLLLLLATSIFKIENLYYFFLLLMVKSTVDLLILRTYLCFIGHRELLKFFLPLQLVYPLYIAYSFISGIFTKILWKGRLVR